MPSGRGKLPGDSSPLCRSCRTGSHTTSGTGTRRNERPQATYLIAATDLRWLEHFAGDGLHKHFDYDTAIPFDPSCADLHVAELARGIDDEHAFERMPILADALQDAGCDTADLLNHLRDTTAAHVRGCWAASIWCWGRLDGFSDSARGFGSCRHHVCG